MNKVLRIITIIVLLLIQLPFGVMPIYAQVNNATPLQNALMQPYPAPEIYGITAWINSPPLTLSLLKGNVILIDFWSYSCIKCIQNLINLNAWYQEYRDRGLVIISIHRPQYPDEQQATNVQQAVNTYNIQFPIGLDNNLTMAMVYSNPNLPADYLIDRNGNIVYINIGGGNNTITDNNIQTLLAERPQQNYINNPTPYTSYPTPPVPVYPYSWPPYGYYYPGVYTNTIIIEHHHHK